MIRKLVWEQFTECNLTCFKEVGKVSKPESSGTLTTSLVISLHDLQTEAQATTSLLPGHKVCPDSILWIISRSNSGGKSTQILWLKPSFFDREEDTDDPSGAICDLPLLPKALYLFFTLNSLTMFLNDIATLLQTNKQTTLEPNQKQKRTLIYLYTWIYLLPQKFPSSVTVNEQASIKQKCLRLQIHRRKRKKSPISREMKKLGRTNSWKEHGSSFSGIIVKTSRKKFKKISRNEKERED